MSIDNHRPPAAGDTVTQDALVNALRDVLRTSATAEPPHLIETHISYVLLTGRYAYKIKKAVDFGFLDFSTLALRRHYCAEELRLNRRLAAPFYLGVVAIRGTPQAPRIDATVAADASPEDDSGDPAIEYAVKMIEFPQSALLDRRLARGELHGETIERIAERVADFHARAASTPPRAELGSAQAVWRQAQDNFSALGRVEKTARWRAELAALAAWSRSRYRAIAGLLARRRAEGRVRECHGDLHLGNIALIDGQPLIFDCIEFSAALRWIDVIDEVAFLVMDLDERGRADLAWRFINAYLEHSGDYAGLRCLSFYVVYRALVRAKVAALRAAQDEATAVGDDWAKCHQYLACAHRALAARRPFLLLMHGVCGSGKTRAAQALLEHLHAVRLRSDVERKRLHGLPALARSAAPPHRGIYDAAGDQATYRRLAQLAHELLADGYPVVIDAACLARWQRMLLRRVAGTLGVALRIVSCRADPATLRQRVAARAAAGNDASDAGLAILAAQLRGGDPLDVDESALAIDFDSATQPFANLVQRVAASLADA